MPRIRKSNKSNSGKSSRPPVFGVPEPIRRSLLDILEDNFQSIRKNIFLIRVLYVGEHTYTGEEDGRNRIENIFRNIVEDVNCGYSDEKLTGMMLYYTKCFFHMVTGSEDIIIKHFNLLLEDEDIGPYLGTMKVVTVIHNVHQRFFNEWTCMPGKPVTLLEKIDPYSDLEKSSKYFFGCVQKVYQLCLSLREFRDKQILKEGEFATGGAEDALSISSVDSYKLETYLRQNYPEMNLISFLLNTKYLPNVTDYVEKYGHVEIPESKSDVVWPIPNTLIPYSLFEKPFDPIPDLPSQVQRMPQEGKDDALLLTDEPDQTNANDGNTNNE